MSNRHVFRMMSQTSKVSSLLVTWAIRGNRRCGTIRVRKDFKNWSSTSLKASVTILSVSGAVLVYDLCRSAVRAGYTTSGYSVTSILTISQIFHAIPFGPDAQIGGLRRMVQIATAIHDAAPRDPFAPLDTPCPYSEAPDTVRQSNQLLDNSSQPLPGSTYQYLFGDRRLATQA